MAALKGENFFIKCHSNRWHYILRYKEGSIPTVADEYRRLKKTEKNRREQKLSDGSCWHDFVTDIDYNGHKVIDFNKENTEYKVVLKEYSDQQEMNLDIIAGNIPDIIMIPEGLVERYAASGLLEDLSPYLEKDAELTEEDFIPSAFEAMKIYDRLYCISPGFELYSLTGREKDVGNGAGWTFEEFNTFLREKGDDTQPFESSDKMDILGSLLEAGLDDFVDWETGTCSFDSQDFRNILELCDQYGTVQGQDDDMESVYERIHEGKILFREGLVDVNEFLTSKDIFGEDVTYIGYPDSNRNGTYFLFDGQLGIYSKSEVKDEAWQFIRIFLTREFQVKYGDILNENSVRQDCFALMLEAQMAEEPYTNSVGLDVVPREGSMDYEGFRMECRPMTQAEAKEYAELVNNTKKAGALIHKHQILLAYGFDIYTKICIIKNC